MVVLGPIDAIYGTIEHFSPLNSSGTFIAVVDLQFYHPLTDLFARVEILSSLPFFAGALSVAAMTTIKQAPSRQANVQKSS
jgi:hypothetical protein